MKNLILLITLFFISCKPNTDLEKIYNTSANLQIEDNDKISQILLDNIKVNMTLITKPEINKKINLYNNLSTEYYNYLTNIEQEIKLKGDSCFFEGDKHTGKGNEYVNKTRNYKIEIEKLTNSKNFNKRLDLSFDMKEVRKGNYTFNYLDYYFNQIPKVQSAAFINSRKKSVLEFENEFINEMRIINNK
jgi:hypothetical protein